MGILGVETVAQNEAVEETNSASQMLSERSKSRPLHMVEGALDCIQKYGP